LLQRQRDADEVRQRAARLLSSVGLAQHLDAYPAEMSTGEQRRAGIARALINAPRLLLADEPTSDLDQQSEHEVMAELLRTCREDGVTLVLVTHALALAAEADQVVHIADGSIVS
jgi:ABC-type lipoprotein export system ATPase subunit